MDKVKAYGLEWHQKNSTSVRDFLIDPLSEFITIDFHSWDCDANVSVDPAEPVIFCQCLPPSEISANPENKIIWIPMWDGVCRFDKQWWNDIPKQVRIISFSKQIQRLSEASGHNTLSLQFFKDPGQSDLINKPNENHLFYWHRTNTYNASFLHAFCKKLNIKKLTVINRPDPGYRPYTTAEIKSIEKLCSVIEVRDFIKHEEYFKYLSEANLFLAPRWTEGIGMSFIEAMCHGQCVFAVDAPTMNEYIIDNHNGILLNNELFYPTLLQRICNKTRRFLALTERDYSINQPSLTLHQDWNRLRKINYYKLGENAQTTMKDGFQIWRQQLKKYHEFIVNW